MHRVVVVLLDVEHAERPAGDIGLGSFRQAEHAQDDLERIQLGVVGDEICLTPALEAVDELMGDRLEQRGHDVLHDPLAERRRRQRTIAAMLFAVHALDVVAEDVGDDVRVERPRRERLLILECGVDKLVAGEHDTRSAEDAHPGRRRALPEHAQPLVQIDHVVDRVVSVVVERLRRDDCHLLPPCFVATVEPEFETTSTLGWAAAAVKRPPLGRYSTGRALTTVVGGGHNRWTGRWPGTRSGDPQVKEEVPA